MSSTASAPDKGGVIATLVAFIIWGLFPLYWHLLQEVPALQIIAHRVLWSTVLVVGLLMLRNGVRWIHAIAMRPYALAVLALTGILISANWGLYIWAVNNGHVVEASLGYFINPLVNVLLGVIILRERLMPLQWLAVAIAALGVMWLAWQNGHPPWISIGLAASFGTYALLRKLIKVDAIAGLGLESLYLLIPAIALIVWGEHGHGGDFIHGWSLKTDLLLVLAGVVSAIPLIGFNYGVQRIPLSLVGLLQYITPTLQLLLGVWVFSEPFGHDRFIGFVLIWSGLAAFITESLLRGKNRNPIQNQTVPD